MDPRQYDAVIAVIGETPYAEGNGDIGRRSLEQRAPAPGGPRSAGPRERQGRAGGDGVLLRPTAVRQQGAQPLRRVRGRLAARAPRARAWPTCWSRAAAGHGFSGTLSYSWPATPCQTPLNAGDEELRAAVRARLRPAQRPEVRHRAAARGDDRPLRRQRRRRDDATEDLELFVRQDVAPYKSYIGSPDNWGGTELGNDPSAVIAHTNIEARTSDVNVQQDARKITWKGGAGQFYLQAAGGGPAPVPQQQRRDRVRHDRDQGANGPRRDQRALHVPVLLRRTHPQGASRASPTGRSTRSRCRSPAWTPGRSSSTTSTRRSSSTRRARWRRPSPMSGGCRARPPTRTP